jgi:hypothetical protein
MEFISILSPSYAATDVGSTDFLPFSLFPSAIGSGPRILRPA